MQFSALFLANCKFSEKTPSSVFLQGFLRILKREVIKIKEKIESFSLAKPAKAGIFYITTNIFTKLIALLATPLFTRLLLPSEYGVYSLYISWMGIISVITALGISGGTIYRALGRFDDTREELISNAIGILLLASLALSILTITFSHTAERLMGLPPLINCMLISEVFLNSAETVVFAYHRYKYSYVKICLINLLYAVISVGVAIILVYFTPIKAEARIFSSFFASFILILPLIRPYFRLKKLYKKEIWEYLLRLSLPLLPNALSTALIAQIDKIMIKEYENTAALGKYSIAYSAGFMLTTLTAALYSALQPWLMRKLNSGKLDAAKALTKRIVFLTSLGLLVFLLVIPEIFKLIAAEEYREAEIAVYPLAVAGYLQFISNILAANIIHTEKTGAISAAGLIAFLFNLLSNLFLIPRYGYPAAAVTTAISYLILIAFEFLYLKKNSIEKVIDLKTLYPLSLSALAIPIYFIRSFTASRFIFAFTVIFISLPSLLKFTKDFIKRHNEKTI